MRVDYAKDLKVEFLSAQVTQLRSVVLANQDRICQAQSMVESEERDLRRVIDGLQERKCKAIRDRKLAEDRKK